jgi:hypothetical protein
MDPVMTLLKHEREFWANRKTHDPEQCRGRETPCVVHNPSEHHMREWPLNFRYDRGLTERICLPHGVGHPDPDDLAFKRSDDYLALLTRYYERFGYSHEDAKEEASENSASEGVHGCDGCCAPWG